MRFDTAPAPHLAPRDSVVRVMGLVLVALLPGAAMQWHLYGAGVLAQLAVCLATALATEAALLALRGRPLAALGDLSALVTGALLALCLPAGAPWWLGATGTAFALVFGKHVYGGLGQNPFNPAMLGYVVLLIAFPAAMSTWPGVDALTQATPLDVVRTELARGVTLTEIGADPRLAGDAAAWLAVAWCAGGALLLATRVIRWHAPVAMLATLALLAALFHGGDADQHPGALFHLTSGAALFGAFFIVTDPVSGATSNTGRLWFGAGVGALTWAIRTHGGYPDGVAFAVLLMNAAVPLIDHWTRPRAYGEAA